MKVLFVGNSYTYYNEMPTLFENLAKENGVEISVDSVTKGGRCLSSNAIPEDAEAVLLRQFLSQNCYDVCFLQEQSTRPVKATELFIQGVKDSFELVKSSCSRVILYETWGRKEGCKMLSELGISCVEMSHRLFDAYEKAAREISAERSRVGLAFRTVCDLFPEIELFQPDCSHPSYEGSCLSALCHYKTVFGALPEKTACLSLSDSVLDVFYRVLK